MWINLGTDCTGIDAAYYAVQQALPAHAQIRYRFASDIDAGIREVLRHTTKPEQLYEDVTRRDAYTLPHVDVYVAGFPCQSFSSLGQQAGTGDPRGRIVQYMVEYIRLHSPKMFVLENIPRFRTTDSGEPFNELMHCLREIGDYDVDAAVLCPTQIGFPHSRRRLFIVGLRKACFPGLTAATVLDPKPGTTRRLGELLLSKAEALLRQPAVGRPLSPNAIRNWCQMLLRMPNCTRKTFIVNLQTSARFAYVPQREVSPCLTRFCCTFFVTHQQRYLTAIEALRLQGFDDPHFLDWFDLANPASTKKSKAYKYAGNSICIPLLRAILAPAIAVLSSIA
jgi:site-specific DNA-cytosine methylase